MKTKKSTAPKSVIIRTYSDYTGDKMLFNDENDLPPVEVIMNTPYSESLKQCLLKRRETLLNRTMTA